MLPRGLPARFLKLDGSTRYVSRVENGLAELPRIIGILVPRVGALAGWGGVDLTVFAEMVYLSR